MIPPFFVTDIWGLHVQYGVCLVLLMAASETATLMQWMGAGWLSPRVWPCLASVLSFSRRICSLPSLLSSVLDRRCLHLWHAATSGQGGLTYMLLTWPHHKVQADGSPPRQVGLQEQERDWQEATPHKKSKKRKQQQSSQRLSKKHFRRPAIRFSQSLALRNPCVQFDHTSTILVVSRVCCGLRPSPSLSGTLTFRRVSQMLHTCNAPSPKLGLVLGRCQSCHQWAFRQNPHRSFPNPSYEHCVCRWGGCAALSFSLALVLFPALQPMCMHSMLILGMQSWPSKLVP